MIIGIDASRANRDNKTGTEWYSWHLIEEFKKMIPANVRIVLYTNVNLKGELGTCPQGCEQKILDWPPKYLWTQIRLWWELLINPPDMLFVPAHTIPFLPIRKKTKVAVTVHDVGFKRFPELYKPIQVWYHDLTMRKIKKRADIIITISEFSKQEIMELYGVDEKIIRVVYLGFDSDKYSLAAKQDTNLKEELMKYGINSPYLLYVGRLEKKKNIGNIIKAFALIKDSQPDLQLVLAGNSGNQFEAISKIISENNLEKEIVLPGYIAAGDLPKIIASAEIFLFPTLYEGFGLPILEAMACGTPVITSKMNPHLEVGGEAAAYADPHKPDELAALAVKIISDANYRQELVEKGLGRAKDFSWKATAEKIFKLLIIY